MPAIAVVQFDALHTALSAVPVVLETGPSAVALVDQIGLTRCLEAPQYARLLRGFLEGTPNCILITEFYGESEAELRSKVDRLQTHLRRERSGALAVTPIFDPQAQQDVWTVRKVALGFLMGVEGDFKPIAFIEDAAVPVEHLSGYIRKLEAFCRDIGTPIAYYAHASAGCLHVRPMVNTKKAEEIAKLPQIVDFAVDLLRGYGGALSSEHGDGRTRSWANEKFFGPDLYRVYREVKAAFDPQNLLNPGNIVNAPAMTENLRYGADYRTLDLKLHLDFSDYGAGGAGFARAVEQCNGAGVCRKEGTGTMCPSYMATRDEAYSTRARANALRAALSGVLPPEALTSERMYEIMDLCVSCKSCKAECPSAVDMARLKFEFLAHYYEKHGIPLRARLFANIHRISRIASGPWAPLVNALMASRPMRALLEAALGISKQRVMPPFARQPFTRWFSTRSRGKTLKVSETFRVSDEVASSEADKGALSRPDSPLPAGRGAGGEGKRQLVLFNDTFNTYNTPEVAIAATEVFEAAGFEVILPGHKCCGRPAISKGLVELARSLAQDTVERLYPFAEQGLPIVGLEPSCLLTLRDEYFHLLPDDPRVPVVAEHCYTFEEFIAKLEAAGELNLPLKRPAAHFLHHGHCHQKALVGTAPGVQTLNLIPGAEVEDTDAGCCGMAGAFGYEAEHYEISMKMGEQRLFPAVRSADDDTIIVAAGTSCRHQIADGTGKRALHPAEVLRRALPQ
jgi:Fe-S oxidoreductase